MMAVMESKRHLRRAAPQGLVMTVAGMAAEEVEGQVEELAQEAVALEDRVEGQTVEAEGQVAARMVVHIRPRLYARQE